jgi:hypothetical protein
MRRKTPSPVAAFDVVPESVVEAAQRLFDLLLACRTGNVALAECDERGEEGQPTGP